MIRRLFCVVACLGLAMAPAQAIDVDDYFRLQRVEEVALSPNGDRLAYVTESLGPSGRQLHLRTLAPGGGTRVLAEFADARQIAWIPGTRRLALLRPVDGTQQLFAWDAETGTVTQLTHAADPVQSYAFATDGRTFAFATRGRPHSGVSLYDRFRNDESGILVDPATTTSHDFLNPDWNALVRPPPVRLWIVAADAPAAAVPAPGEPRGAVGSYHWSSDGQALSVQFVASDMTASPLGGNRTSLGLFDLAAGRFDVLARAIPPSAGRPGISYLGGEWVPDGRRLLVRRVTESDPWVSDSFPDWAVVDPRAGVAAARWRPVELYPSGLRLIPISAEEILVEATVRGVRSLFTLTSDGLRRSPAAAGVDGSTGLFAFSGDHRQVAFVRESLTHPPELFVRDENGPARQVTDLNGGIAAGVRYRAREVRWPGRDGVEISGWLLEPQGAGPWPMITHVHGGPAFPFPDGFAAYFDYWPYPLEVYAARGLAVFLPNYRGTQSFGRQVATPRTGEEPVDDIRAGIEHLVRAGIADPDRLAISGHSNGALVGPLAMARARNFRAASFAEGVANSVVMYELMSGDANREIHDPLFGASLYDDPQRYLHESADLHLAGVSTASLFEAGAYTSPLFMLGFPKAARRFGMPAEFVVYPRTAHNIVLPNLRRESAERNLDWFEFWLLGREHPGEDRASQYERWRRMRVVPASSAG